MLPPEARGRGQQGPVQPVEPHAVVRLGLDVVPVVGLGRVVPPDLDQLMSAGQPREGVLPAAEPHRQMMRNQAAPRPEAERVVGAEHPFVLSVLAVAVGGDEVPEGLVPVRREMLAVGDDVPLAGYFPQMAVLLQPPGVLLAQSLVPVQDGEGVPAGFLELPEGGEGFVEQLFLCLVFHGDVFMIPEMKHCGRVIWIS